MNNVSYARIIALTSIAMIAFAGNSLLCRVALRDTGIDPASFTTIRLASGAIMLWLVVRFRGSAETGRGNAPSALALFAYAAGFSYAYISLSAATGALLLFGAVQATMIGYGIWAGERLVGRQMIGLMLASGGLIGLLLPGLSAPPLFASLLMLGAGVAWGVYSLQGKGTGDPTKVTAGNFLLAVPVTALLSLFMLSSASLDRAGIMYAVASGAVERPGHCRPGRSCPPRRADHAAAVAGLHRHPRRHRPGYSDRERATGITNRQTLRDV